MGVGDSAKSVHNRSLTGGGASDCNQAESKRPPLVNTYTSWWSWSVFVAFPCKCTEATMKMHFIWYLRLADLHLPVIKWPPSPDNCTMQVRKRLGKGKKMSWFYALQIERIILSIYLFLPGREMANDSNWKQREIRLRRGFRFSFHSKA